MRTRLSWVLTAVGVLAAVAGLAVMLILGPDSRFSTGPHDVDTDGIAVVTAPKVITWVDLQVDVLAEVPALKPVFVGLGNSVDVQNYVGESARIEVTDFHTPWKPKTRQVEGKNRLPGAPTAFDWWIADSAGRGGAGISTTLPDETVSLAILSVGDTNLTGLKVSLAYGVKGGFIKGLGLLLLGAGAILLSRLLRRGDDIWSQEEVDAEEVVYVFVDDDGVEHEISAEEAEDYEVVDVEETDDEDTEGESVPATAAAGWLASITSPLRSGLGSIRSKLGPMFQPRTVPAGVADSSDEEIVYILVGEDGVEREISAEEAELLEFVDEVVVDLDEPSEDEPSEEEPSEEEASEEEPSETEAEPAPDTDERVMYVFVDEDGVEHEISEDELADFEVVTDDEEDKP